MAPRTTAIAVAAVAALAHAQDPWNCTTQPAGAFTPLVLTNSKGLSISVIPYGGTLTNLMVPDKNGVLRDVVLGFDTKSDYCAASHTYFGASIGRIANRIAKGTFVLDGKSYHTPINEQNAEGGDTLHGGNIGFDRRVWTATRINASAAVFTLFSPDGEMGFPGDLNVSITWAVSEPTQTPGSLGTWSLDYHATTPTATVVGLTNHAYFNLNANIDNAGTVGDHVLTIAGGKFIAIDSVLLPTGVIGDVAAAPWLDFRAGKTIGKDIKNGTVSPSGGERGGGDMR